MSQVLITGASSGIGRQLAVDYAHEGWIVYACGRNEAALSALRDECAEQAPGAIQPLVFDVCDRNACVSAAKTLPQLDLLVLNAGNCEYIDDPMAFDSQLFERVITTNLISIGYCLEALLPKLSRGAQLALMSSSATLLPFSRAQAYGASKAGVDYLAESLAVDLQPHGIAVSLIRPCFVETPLTDKNNFAMPGRISVHQASDYIRNGLLRRRFLIEFSPGFIRGLRLLGLLPRSLWTHLQHRSKRSLA